MKKWKQALSLLLAAGLLSTTICMQTAASDTTKKTSATYWPKGPTVESASAIVMEATSGTILYSKNIHKKRYPASITKIMTTLLALENCSLDETVTFSHDSVYKIEGTHIARDVGEEMTLEDTLYAVMLASANECAYATAEHVGGTYDKFIDMMNEKATELGCEDTHFNNPHGLPDENHYTSAYDMALIARAAIQNETFRMICGTKTYTIPPTNKHKESTPLINHHGMLTAYKTSRYLYDYCIGGKTGYTTVAGNTLVTFAEKDGMTLICVVMKANTPNHYIDTTNLLDYCFDNFQLYNVSKNETNYTDTTLQDEVAFDGNDPLFSLDTTGVVVLPKSASFSEAVPSINYDKADSKENTAGTLDYYYGDHYVGGTNITVSDQGVTQFQFGNSEIQQSDGSNASVKKVVQIKWKWIFTGIGLVALLVFMLFVGLYLSRNRNRIRYHRELRKDDRMREKMARGRKRRHKRRRR